MAKSNYSTVIAIDSVRSAFHFYSMMGNDKESIAHHIKSFPGKLFDEAFFVRFKDAVREYAANNPSDAIRKVTVVLPDCAVLTDTVKIPTMKGAAQTKKTLETTLRSLYRNYNDLRILSQVADQNKQYSTFSIAAVKKEIVSSIYAICSENKMLVDTLTFASGASIGAATQLNPKLKGASYLFLDIKDVYSRFVFVAGGKAMGSYTLPFGYEFLQAPKVTQEDMLFDHSCAELAVLNAKERAKSKKLTIMALEDILAEIEEQNAAEEDSEDELLEEPAEGEREAAEEDEIVILENQSTPLPQINQKIFVRKSPRKLPKFMLRPIPETPEEISYENFRVFIKWALTLIQGNENLTELGKPAFVCVNFPRALVSVLDRANEEQEENGIGFQHFTCADGAAGILANMELYGGLFPKQLSGTVKF